MKINTKPFLAAIEPLLPITQKRSTLPIMSCFHVEAFGGWLTVRAMNLDEFAERTVECEGDLAPFCVSAERLATYLRHELAEGIELNLSAETHRLKYQGGALANIAVLEAAEYPAPPKQVMESVGLNCEDLADCVEAVEWVASLTSKERLTASPHYGTVNVVTSEKSMMTLATTGVMVGRCNIPAICSPCDFDLMREYVPTFCAAMRAEESDLLLGDGHVGVAFKGGRWIGRLLEERFPTEAALEILNKEFKKIGSMVPSDLLPHLEICNSFVTAAKKFISVRIEFEAKRAVIKFCSTDSDDYEFPVDGRFEPETWSANSRDLLAVVRKLKPDSPFEIRSGDDKHYLTDGKIDVLLVDVRLS